MAIQDYFDRFPGEYEAEREKYEKSMDKYFEDLDMLSINKFGRHYDELSITEQKEIESMIDNKKARTGSAIYQLDDGRIVGEKEAEEYRNNYGKMMDGSWEQYKNSKESKDTTVYQLDDGRIVGPKAAEEYRNNYGKMMDDAWEQYKKSKERKGSACPDCENVSKIILNRLTRGI